MTDREKERFLDALGELGSVEAACRATGLRPSEVYRLRRKDREFDTALILAIMPHIRACVREQVEAVRKWFSRPAGTQSTKRPGHE